MDQTFSLHEMLTFFQAPLLGGMGIALLAGPLGALLVWQRLAYLGDALAHASLLGIGLALLCAWPLLPTTLFITGLLAVCLFFFLKGPPAAAESLMIVFSQGFMALGLLLMTCTQLSSIDLMAYLLGDFLTLSYEDVVMIGGVAIGFGVFLWCFWQPLLCLVIHPELAHVQGIPVSRLRLAFLIFASLILVLAIQTTGVLLVTSLLVFPILTLHPWVNTPEQLCVYASGLGVVSVWGGFALSLLLNVAPGPLMTVFLLCCFVLSRFFSSLYQRHAKI